MLTKPGPTLAFLPQADAQRLAECLVAFANAGGGMVILGLNEDGDLVNPIWDQEAEDTLRQAVLQCRPPVIVQWERVERGNTRLIGIRVPRSPQLHSLSDGRVLVRHGTDNRLMTGQELAFLASSHQPMEYEAEVVPGAHAADLDPLILNEYLGKREARGAAKVESLPQFLFEIGATDREGHPTMAGLLLFGRNPQAFAPQSGVVFVRFLNNEPRGEDGAAGYGRREELTGPLPRIIERAWNLVYAEMYRGATIPSLEREERVEYPRFAVREAIINAVCHRDYRIKGRRIEIRMYNDRLEVISPGGLPGYMTLDNLVDDHFSRNPRLVNGLYYWGYIEELGLGIDRMIEEMVQQGHPPPHFRDTGYSFTVTLFNAIKDSPLPRWTQNMNERQTQALDYVRREGSITNGEYQRLCDGISPETLRRDLADLVSRGLLLKVGSKKGTYYILK